MIWRDFPVAVHRTARRKTMSIVIERDGSLAVQVPAAMTEERILEILNRKEYEVFQKRALWQEANREHVSRQFLSGQSFLYLGRNYTLSVVQGQKRHLIFKNGTFFLSSDAKNPRGDFIRFYKRQAKAKIAERLEALRDRIAIRPKKIQIREMTTRWGSCTPSGNIYYNWRCVMMPLFVLDYLIVHELVHIEHPNHSREFWQRLSGILPDYNYAKDWLKKNGVRAEI